MKNVLIGISGGIAVYKVCSLVRLFKKAGYGVDVIMTENATQFVAPLTFETLSNRPVTVDMFNPIKQWEVEHISLAKKADIFVVCPATANIIAKMACGIADDMLSTTALAVTCPTVICPAMNTNMYENVAVQQNITTLLKRGVKIVEAGDGFLACGDSGKGRMAEPEQIFEFVNAQLCQKQDLSGRNVLITCGATAEQLDDVRFLTNFSSGKMGSAIASECLNRGANVTLILGRHSAKMPECNIVSVQTTEQMHKQAIERVAENDLFFMVAAPCDYRPKEFSSSKIKSDSLTVEFVKNPDIAKSVGQLKGKKPLVIFSAETDSEIANATKKLNAKNADFVVVNNIKLNDVFNSDTNVISIVDKHKTECFDKMTKRAAAQIIVDKAVALL